MPLSSFLFWKKAGYFGSLLRKRDGNEGTIQTGSTLYHQSGDDAGGGKHSACCGRKGDYGSGSGRGRRNHSPLSGSSSEYGRAVKGEDKVPRVLAGKKANILGIPVVLDPVGAGASRFRAEQLELLTKKVRFSVIRCNQEEAKALLHIWEGRSGGVESGADVEEQEQLALAERLALDYGCTAFVSGKRDAVSDGKESRILEGGSRRLARLTGGGCMLSALCALMCGLGMTPYEAALTAGRLWRESAALAERQTEAAGAGIGTFQTKLFDAVEELFYRGEKE